MPEENNHQTPEYRMARGFSIATFEDLDGLTDEGLAKVVMDCFIEPADPDSCVPCRAYEMLTEGLLKENQDKELLVTSPGSKESVTPLNPDGLLIVGRQEVSVAQQFAAQVDALNTLVLELLEGPPIPPKNVTLEELAALVLGAEKYLKMLDAQDLELAPQQQHIRSTIEQVIRKVKNNG